METSTISIVFYFLCWIMDMWEFVMLFFVLFSSSKILHCLYFILLWRQNEAVRSLRGLLKLYRGGRKVNWTEMKTVYL